MNPQEVACAKEWRSQISVQNDPQSNVAAARGAISCDKPSGSPPGVAPPQPDRSGATLLRQATEAGYRPRIVADAQWPSTLPGSSGYIDDANKAVVVNEKVFRNSAEAISLLAHEYTHVLDAPERLAARDAYQRARAALWKKQETSAQQQRAWDNRGPVHRGAGYETLREGVGIAYEKQPELAEKEPYRTSLIETEVEAYTREREIQRQLGIVCLKSLVGTPVPDPECQPFTRDNLLEQLRQMPAYAPLFSPDWLKADLYSPNLPRPQGVLTAAEGMEVDSAALADPKQKDATSETHEGAGYAAMREGVGEEYDLIAKDNQATITVAPAAEPITGVPYAQTAEPSDMAAVLELHPNGLSQPLSASMEY